jgi:hypothetical protein
MTQHALGWTRMTKRSSVPKKPRSKFSKKGAESRPVHPQHPAIIDAPPESYTGGGIGIAIFYPGWKVGRGK